MSEIKEHKKVLYGEKNIRQWPVTHKAVERGWYVLVRRSQGVYRSREGINKKAKADVVV